MATEVSFSSQGGVADSIWDPPKNYGKGDQVTSLGMTPQVAEESLQKWLLTAEWWEWVFPHHKGCLNADSRWTRAQKPGFPALGHLPAVEPWEGNEVRQGELDQAPAKGAEFLWLT